MKWESIINKQFKEKVKKVMESIFRLSPNYYSLLAVILISLSVNLYTNFVSSSDPPNKRLAYILSSIYIMVSALFLSAISWNLEKLHSLLKTAPDQLENRDQVWHEIISADLKKLSIYLIVSIIGLTGLIFLL